MRKSIQLLDKPKAGGHLVNYIRHNGFAQAYYESPSGEKDHGLVKKYLETQAKLEQLGVAHHEGVDFRIHSTEK